MRSLTQSQTDPDYSKDPPEEVLSWIKSRFLAIGQVSEFDTLNKLFSAILAGNTVILVEGIDKGITASTVGGEQRGVDEPQSQTVIRGPREGFTENLRTNTSLIRRKIRNPNLWIVDRTIGRVTQTHVAVMYIHGIASDNVVQEILKRLDRIDIDSVLESGYMRNLSRTPPLRLFRRLQTRSARMRSQVPFWKGKWPFSSTGAPLCSLLPLRCSNCFSPARIITKNSISPRFCA